MSPASALCCGILPLMLLCGTVRDEPAPRAECGVNCLYVACLALDPAFPPDLNELRVALQPGSSGVSIAELQRVADAHQVHNLAIRTSLEALQLRSPQFCCIAHLSNDHFVLISEITDTAVHVIDPPGEMTLSAAAFENSWDGTCLLLSTAPLQPEEEIAGKIWWQNFRRRAAMACLGVVITCGLGWGAARRLKRR